MAITRTAWIDDSGDGTTGTVINNAEKTTLYNQIDAADTATLAAAWVSPTLSGVPTAPTAALGTNTTQLATMAAVQAAIGAIVPVVQTTTVTGNQDNFALTANCALLRVNNATLVTFRGLSAGVDGQRLTIVSLGAGEVDLSHQDTNSTAANRLINFATSGVTPLAAGVGSATVMYDGTTARWRLVAHAQGDWITRAYASGNFTGSGSMTWTVDSGDVNGDRYVLNGRQLTYAFDIATSTVAGTPSTNLQITIPNGYASAGIGTSLARVSDNGGAFVAGFTGPSSTFVVVKTMTAANWTAATNATAVQGELTFGVT